MKVYQIKRILIGFLSLFLVACNPTSSELFDESALRELPHFEYMGYTYYVHPHLSIYHGYPSSELEEAVSKLDSYGIKTWFVPSSFELKEAVNYNLLQKEYCYVSTDGFLGYYRSEWVEEHNGIWGDCDYTVLPMVKFRIL